MCEFKSGVVFKNRVVLAPEGNESHSDLLEKLGVEDITIEANFVRVELIPPNGNISADVNDWKYTVDQDFTPDWYQADPLRYENEFRNKVREYVEKRAVRICNLLWTIVEKGGYTYHFLYGTLFDSKFGDTNNFAKSDVLRKLKTHELVDDLKNKFGDKLVSITTDLTSMDGLKDYGQTTGDILSIPTVQTIMAFGENIPPIGKAYWTPTPNQTPTRRDYSCVRCVRSSGSVDYCGCNWSDGGVRPFFILQS